MAELYVCAFEVRLCQVVSDVIKVLNFKKIRKNPKDAYIRNVPYFTLQTELLGITAFPIIGGRGGSKNEK